MKNSKIILVLSCDVVRHRYNVIMVKIFISYFDLKSTYRDRGKMR